MIREVVTAVRTTLVLWVLTAILYPLSFLLVGQLVPGPANGSLIAQPDGTIVGSALIGQPFSAEKYFWGRPSAVEYSSFATYSPDAPENLTQRTGISGASNLAPSSAALRDRVSQQFAVQQLATADLIYASGSGLDPHISPEAAQLQLARVATARSLPPDQITTLIQQNTEGRFLGIWGEPHVHVLKLNMAIDALQPNQ